MVFYVANILDNWHSKIQPIINSVLSKFKILATSGFKFELKYTSLQNSQHHCIIRMHLCNNCTFRLVCTCLCVCFVRGDNLFSRWRVSVFCAAKQAGAALCKLLHKE